MLGPWAMIFAHEEKTGDDQAASVRRGVWFGFRVLVWENLLGGSWVTDGDNWGYNNPPIHSAAVH